jgi:ABC-2 type transport system permease protein
LNWFYIVGILGGFTLSLTWVAVIAGLLAKTPDGAGAFAYPIIFLPFISSAFVLTENMAPFIRGFAKNQPVTPIVDALRNLLANIEVNSSIWMALAICISITAISYVISIRIFESKK